MIIRDNEYFQCDFDVSKEEYIKIQKYTLMRNNAEDFLTKHISDYNVGLGAGKDNYFRETYYNYKRKCINNISSEYKRKKILCHTLELANLQKDVLKILNKKNDRGFIYESELLFCFAYPQYPNILTEQFESDEEIIIPEPTKPKPYNYIPIIIVISIVIACVALSAYLESLLNIK